MLTLTDLSSKVPGDRRAIDYAVKRFGPAPAGRIGTTRVWSPDQLPAIRKAFKKTARHHASPRSRG